MPVIQRTCILLLALCQVALLHAQIEPSQARLDFGEINKGHDRVIELILVNKNTSDVDLLRVDAGSKEYDVRTESLKLAAGAEMRLRVKLNPVSRGSRRDELLLYFSSETLSLPMKADVEYIDVTDHTPCPDFDRPAQGQSATWQAYFKVVNRETGDPISGAELFLDGRTSEPITYTVDRKGELFLELPIDFYMLKVKEEGYASFSLESYINKRNKDFLIQLRPGMGGVAVLRPSKPTPPAEPAPADTVIQVVEEPEPVATVTDFSISEYKANNVVFLIDVSTSMRQRERIEILKENMLELAEMLRPEDIVSIVTYATSTDVLISGVRASDKTQIQEAIESLSAAGNTAGAAGLKKAYQICERNQIEGGNNHIYLATDGAFDSGSDKLARMVSRNSRDERHLSVLAIRSSKWADAKMEVLAERGRGTHLSVKDETEKDALRSLIRSQSKR